MFTGRGNHSQGGYNTAAIIASISGRTWTNYCDGSISLSEKPFKKIFCGTQQSKSARPRTEEQWAREWVWVTTVYKDSHYTLSLTKLLGLTFRPRPTQHCRPTHSLQACNMFVCQNSLLSHEVSRLFCKTEWHMAFTGGILWHRRPWTTGKCSPELTVFCDWNLGVPVLY